MRGRLHALLKCVRNAVNEAPVLSREGCQVFVSDVPAALANQVIAEVADEALEVLFALTVPLEAFRSRPLVPSD